MTVSLNQARVNAKKALDEFYLMGKRIERMNGALDEFSGTKEYDAAWRKRQAAWRRAEHYNSLISKLLREGKH